MKSKLIINVFVIAIVSFVLIGATSSFAAEGGRLIVKRVANLGEDISLSLSVDGKEIAQLGEARSYDGYLTPGDLGNGGPRSRDFVFAGSQGSKRGRNANDRLHVISYTATGE